MTTTRKVNWLGAFKDLLEGSNNAIKVLKRTAYDFLDFDYFRLKILARLPGRGYARSTLLYGRLNRSLAVTKARM